MVEWSNLGVQIPEMEIGGYLAILNRQRRLEYSSEARSAFGMPQNSFDGANKELFLIVILFRTAREEGFMYGLCLNSYAR